MPLTPSPTIDTIRNPIFTATAWRSDGILHGNNACQNGIGKKHDSINFELSAVDDCDFSCVGQRGCLG
jgi:hypothetical protein